MNINFLVFCVIEGYVDIEWVGCVCVDKFKKCVYQIKMFDFIFVLFRKWFVMQVVQWVSCVFCVFGFSVDQVYCLLFLNGECFKLFSLVVVSSVFVFVFVLCNCFGLFFVFILILLIILMVCWLVLVYYSYDIQVIFFLKFICFSCQCII